MAAPTTEQKQLSIIYPNATQHNILAQNPIHMGLYEARIFSLMLGCLKMGMTAFPPVIRVPVKSVVTGKVTLEGDEKPTGKQYAQIEKACKDLYSRSLNLLPVNSAKGNISEVRLVQDVQHIKGTGYIEATFGNKAAPYLLQLKDFFTIGQVAELMMLRNANSQGAYWYLKSRFIASLDIYEFDIPVDEFRDIIMGEASGTYKQFKQFNRDVLTPVIADLNAAGFKVTLTPVTHKRVTTKLRFTIPRPSAVTKAVSPKAKPKAKLSAETLPGAYTVAPQAQQLELGIGNPQADVAVGTMHERFRTRLVDHLRLTQDQFEWVVNVLKLTAVAQYEDAMKRTFKLYQTSKDVHSMAGITNVSAWAMAEVKKVFRNEFKATGA